MLSQETAVGSFPVEAVAMMASIAERTEPEAPYERWNEERVRRDERDPAYTVAYSACAAARQLELAALVIPTLSGRSARIISAHRPRVPIYALSPGKETVRRCGLMWGVQAARMRRQEVAAERRVGEPARDDRDQCRQGERGDPEPRQPRHVVDDHERTERDDPRVQHGEEAAALDPVLPRADARARELVQRGAPAVAGD